MSLDLSQPFADVIGLPGVRYEQDGRYYNQRHQQVSIAGEIIIQSAQESFVSDDRPLEQMHWRHLRAMVEQFGGTWTNKEDALIYLNRRTETPNEAA